MTSGLYGILSRTLLVVGLASAWDGLATANEAVFYQFMVTPYASFIYLPAALRVIYPLVFRNVGYFGIICGSFLVVQGRVNDGIIDTAFLAVISGLAPFIGISFFQRLFTTRADLADLKTIHFFSLATLCAASNAALMNLYFALSGRLLQPLDLALTIFIGDVAGIVIVLFLTSLVLTFFMSRRRV